MRGQQMRGQQMSKKQILREQIDHIKKAFDWKFYLNYYPDLKKNLQNTEMATLNHFLEYGRYEGRKINPNQID